MSLAFVFPGQGSQSVGMMNGYHGLPIVRETFEEAGEILKQDLWAMVASGSAEELNLTVNTQPVMLAAGVAVFRAWNALQGARPTVLAGHSLGEYTALVASGALSFADALPLVRFRAQAMQEAVAEGVGGMAAILGLDDDAVRAVCAEAAQGEVLEAVNFNSPGQVVIAGHKTAVERGMALAKKKGAKRALPLPVSVPSHCALMRPAADALTQRLRTISIKAPQIPVVHNADVKSYGDESGIKDALARQLYSPVRWAETVRSFADQGIVTLAECGPGKVLAGLNRRIDGNMQAFALSDEAALRQALDTLRIGGE
ncbi:MAG: [acyl-carrier-protein] S-malonyltransferase [Hydrogenophilales bacterium CG_4_9_14_3_um_filter_59_35]|nr:MAG: [acyl-carrier-protein] S-malonyltransferase [Hydrogenophilales bacterium CG18_big_fil_WC_8_21_14_2_50_58_12]PIX99161.1 MAG: [acyl-carrier-protein] S-malonyltransferase [Hydrogenophilales bacterium CG_4_10_14_3_um_filter_58_23]PJB04295.1 MAG: [acyl-carrier-protein] S-malonyltransferase [Hydrogenophilales bacterium CG_4_9_14_3_um_filter_59_35]